MPSAATSGLEVSTWSEVLFETARDLGPALMGRPLGPADVAACPILPEVAVLIADLERAGSARLAGMPGAGKSICILQAARQIHDRGWRVLRLDDPIGVITPIVESPIPTLYLVDDAHLARPQLLRQLEERATTSSWVLSAHTISESKGGSPGAIQLDEKRAVRVIADGLRASPETTLAAVRRADDEVGDRIGDEPLDSRLHHAADSALYPWQFCFILGGGWRRASALASSARAAGADLILAAAAIRQLATRDARCSRNEFIRVAGNMMPTAGIDAAIGWLLSQRLLLSIGDLRCPHQRLASVLLRRILEEQSDEGRKTIAGILEKVFLDETTPLSGLSVLLRELSTPLGNHQWKSTVQASWLTPVLARCWAAKSPLDVRDACWVLNNLHGYLAEEMVEFANHKETLASWIETAPEDACYAIGWVINHVSNTDKALAESIVALINPCNMAQKINDASPSHACQIADLISMIRVDENDEWKASYLKYVDRDACRQIVSNWPKHAYLSVVASFCKHFCYFEPEFGLTLIEALIPAIADRLRADPQDAFHEINDIVWSGLRLYDPLGIYVGKLAPTRRMRQVGRKICACWSPQDLAGKLSRSTQRSFQSAAGLLGFMRKAAPKQFEATVLALDWNMIDQAIGGGWSEEIGDARMLLGIVHSVPTARRAVEVLIEQNEARIVTMSPHLAALAPTSALRHVAAGKRIALSNWGQVAWELGALVLARFAQSEPTLVPALLEPHYVGLASTLSQPSPTFYNDSLLFLRIFVQVAPNGVSRVLDLISVETAERGWRNALCGRENNRIPGAKAQARQVASLLIHYALDRNDAVGALAQRLRLQLPRQSCPPAEILEQIDLTSAID